MCVLGCQDVVKCAKCKSWNNSVGIVSRKLGGVSIKITVNVREKKRLRWCDYVFPGGVISNLNIISKNLIKAFVI